MAEAGRIPGTRGTAVRPPFKPYVWKGEPEPPAVTAARERHRARRAELDAMAAGEAMPDPGPGHEWYRELAAENEDELAALDEARDRYQDALAALDEARDRYQDALAAAPGPAPAPPPVTAPSRCGRCGYLTTAAGHRVMCDE